MSKLNFMDKTEPDSAVSAFEALLATQYACRPQVQRLKGRKKFQTCGT